MVFRKYLEAQLDNLFNLRSVDLNLLVFYDALMTELHVTRAANRIAVSQSAMSNALARLRHVFQDDLFVRTAKGMEPTPRAIELGPLVRAILQQTTRLMESDLYFDAATSERQFVCRMSDLVGSLVLPPVMARIRTAAPSLALEILHLPPESTVTALEADQLDLAVSMHLRHKNTIRSEPLFSDRMVCLMREGHPLSTGNITMTEFLAYSHVRVAMSPTDIRFVDSVLEEQGLQRKVALTVPHWLLVPGVLVSTDLLTVMSERAAHRFVDSGTVMRPLPFPTDQFDWTMYWHQRHENSRAHLWLLEQVRAASKEVKKVVLTQH
jgi:DNA-binding transcriptional LysR family regulator